MRSLSFIVKTLSAALIAGALSCGPKEEPDNSGNVAPISTSTPPNNISPLTSVPTSVGRIAFIEKDSAEPPDSNKDIWIANPDGSSLKKLVDGCEGQLKFSPDGRLLAFEKNYSNGSRYQIIDLDGNVQDEILPPPNYRNISFFSNYSWTPDGQKLLFSCGYLGVGLFEYDRKNKTLTQLISSASMTLDHCPAMSPNLDKIAYIHHTFGTRFDIRVYDVNQKTSESIANSTGSYHDEIMELFWLNNEQLMFECQGNKKTYLVNTATKQMDEIPTLGNMQLSPDRSTMYFLKKLELYSSSVSDLAAGNINPVKISNSRFSGGVVSPDGKYIFSGSKSTNGNESSLIIKGIDGVYYKFLNLSDLSDTHDKNAAISFTNCNWSP